MLRLRTRSLRTNLVCPVYLCCSPVVLAVVIALLLLLFSGDPQELVVADSPLKEWMDIKDIKLLNLGRDVTPAKYIDAVATDFGLVPPTSSYAILRKAEESG
eukprot:m.176709 g.176709  ORF g.176709 m.176709 type:complete len:102 (-) comp13535_c0_seq5:2634-2939(-)